MDAKTARDVTRLLRAMGAGDDSAFDQLVPQIYDELRRLARAQMRGERSGHTLDTTGLVHETYLRLRQQRKRDWIDRSQFFAIAALTMRRILVNWATARKREKRGRGIAPEPLDALAERLPERSGEREIEQILAVDAALERLGELSPRTSRVVECRYFGGLTVEETALALGVSQRTVKREWSLAKSWLHTELSGAKG